MRSMRPVVVFDIDDTLYPEIDYIRSGIRQAFAALGLKASSAAFEAAYIARFRKGERSGLIQAAARDLGECASAEGVAGFLSRYREQAPQIALSRVAREGLAGLHGRGIPIAAVSDGDAVRQERKVAALGLRPWVDPIVLTGALGAGIDKKDALPFRIIEDHFGAGCRYIYAADNALKDFIHPTKLGWTTIQMQRPDRVYREPAPAGVMVVSDDASLFAMIERLVADIRA